MADDGNEDSWLYGSSNPEPPEDNENEKSETKEDATEDEKVNDNETAKDNLDENNDASDGMEEEEESPGDKGEDERENGEMESDDESDDDINVVIGDIKSGPSYNIKQRANLIATNIPPVQEKPKQPTGKFNIEEFETVGTINGVQAHEFSIDSLDEKPWRKPGADITDYFNYGFNEDTWRGYCERQKKMRLNESGVGLQGLAVGLNNANNATAANNRTLTTLANDNSKYTSASAALRRAGPPPGRKMTGSIDVIGGNGISSRREDGTLIKGPGPPAKENVIQVMTADRREYSRTGTKFDPGVPPPFQTSEQDSFYNEHDAYNYGYEPTQDWASNIPINTGWAPSGIKELTPGPQMIPPPINMPPPMGGPNQMRPMGPMGGPPPHMSMNQPPMFMPPMHGNPMHDRERDRERDRDQHRERERDRDRDRERDRDRDLKSEDKERPGRDRDEESPSRDRDRSTRDRSTKPDRDRDRYRERRRDRSRSRERSRRRSRSRDRDHRSRDKKKSHKKDKEESD